MSNEGYAGRNFILKLGNGATTESFVTIGGLQTTKSTINNNPVDVSDDSSAWQKLHSSAGIQSMDLSGDGITKADVSLVSIRAASMARTPIDIQLVGENGDTYEGSYAIVTFAETGAYNDAQKFSLSLKSSGAIAFTPGM